MSVSQSLREKEVQKPDPRFELYCLVYSSAISKGLCLHILA